MKPHALAVTYYLALALILLSSCDRLKRSTKYCEEDGYSSYKFNLPFYYTPNTDTFQLGDTLWIESSFSNQLYNEYNGKTYTLNDFKFGMFGVFQDLSTNPTIGYYNFILVDTSKQIDQTSKNGAHFNMDYVYSDGMYYWKRGIVLNKKGAFFIEMGSYIGEDQLSKTQQSITQCPSEYVDIRSYRTNGNNNYYLVNTSPDPYIKQGEDVFKNAIVFYVKE